MTIQEMHYHIDQGLQKNASFVYSNFEPEEIDAFINKMILRFIKDRFDKSDPSEAGFEAFQKRIDDIRELVTPYSEILISGLLEGSDAFITLPSDYMFYISGQVSIGYDQCFKTVSDSIITYVPLRVIKHSEFYNAIRDPFRKSTPESGCIMTIDSNRVNIYGGKRFILKGVNFNYIRIPLKVELSSSTDCELAQHTHDEIVDLTVQHILEVIESPRYQSNSIQSKNTE